MIRSIVGASLKFRYIVLAIALGLVVYGATQVPNTPVDVFPEFAPPRVEIQTLCIGLSPDEVESLVTVPLEQALNGVEGLDTMRSKSVTDLSSITLLFKPGTDEILARQLVQERMAAVIPTLPTWAAPPVMMPPISSTGRFIKVGLSSKSVSLVDMSMITYWTIRPKLLSVPGVANVMIWGERIKIPTVQVDPERMGQYDVTVDEVMEVTADALDVGILRYANGSVIGTGGFVETPNQRLSVRPVQSIKSAADLAQVPIGDKQKPDGTPLVLADVADVAEGTWPLIGDSIINDGPGLMLIIAKYPWANTLQVTHGVEEALAELQPGLPGIEVDSTIFRPATFVELALENLTRALLIGCLLVVVILALFLFEWRTALISMLAIPLSLVAGFVVLSWFGATINTMILAGFVIAVGVVVDDAIIDVENITRRLRQNRREGRARSTASVVLEGSLEVRGAIIHATLIDAVVLLPIFFIGGLSGAFFQPLAIAYGLAVLASMFVALTVTPALCLILLRNAPIERRSSPLTRWLQAGYERVLTRIVDRPGPVFAAVAAILLLGIVVVPRLGQSLLPQFKERDFLMHWVTKPGTSMEEMQRISLRASQDLRAIPGVRNFGSHIGQAVSADEVYGVNFSENWISVDPSADYDTTVAEINRVVNSYPGLQHDVQTYLKERIKEVLTGTSETMSVRIYGSDLKTLRAKADEVYAVLDGTPGLKNLHVQLQTEMPQMDVQVDLDKARSFGLTPGDVRRAAATLIAGEEVGDLFRDGKAYDVNVWSTPATRQRPESVRQLLIDTPDGRRVRLGDVADVQIAPTASAIFRQDSSRYINVDANVTEGDLGAVMAEVDQRLAKVDFPLGYHAEVLGEFAERQAAQSQIFYFAIAAAIGVLLILLVAFGTARLAMLSFLTLPSALVGGVLAAYLTGGIVSLGSLVGFLTVFGIAARNGIMLISHCEHLEQYEGETFGKRLAVRGAVERLSPITMTALATGLALIPLVVAGEIPGAEIEYPMAIVILGGLLTSTLLNLFVVPSLYLRFGKGAARSARLSLGQVEQREPAQEGLPRPAAST